MAPRTRGHFLAHQADIRGEEAVEQFTAEWSAKTAAQRRRWAAAFVATADANRQRNDQTAVAAKALAVVIVKANNPVRDMFEASHWKEFPDLAREAEAEVETLRHLADELSQAWTTLHDEEAQHAMVSPASTAYDQTQVAMAIAWRDSAAQEAPRMAALAQSPPVPEHPPGIKRMAEEAAPTNDVARAQINVRAGQNNSLRVPDEDNRVRFWRYAKKLGGNQGLTWLWLGYDDDERVVDVFHPPTFMRYSFADIVPAYGSKRRIHE